MRKRNTYTIEFKHNVVRKICAPNGPSANQLSKDLGIGQATLSRWVRTYGNLVPMNEKSTLQWSLVEQQNALLEFNRLPESKRGAFLRSRGLTTADIERFESQVQEALQGVAQPRRGRPEKSQEEKQLAKELKKAKKEIRRKDRALAETAARVVLLKKTQLLFGEESEEND